MSKQFDRNECINKLVESDKPVNLGWTDAELQAACGCKGECTKATAEESAKAEVIDKEIKAANATTKKTK